MTIVDNTSVVDNTTVVRNGDEPESRINYVEQFWDIEEKNKQHTQLQRYVQKNSPECIKKIIAIGGGVRMGTTMERIARFIFPSVKPRETGKRGSQTGYDHTITNSLGIKKYIEQKSSGHWGESDYTWQHVEPKHKWDVLLLCGIDYFKLRFWFMDRTTLNQLIESGKITNQGSKSGESSQGLWFEYSAVKEHLIEIQNDEHLLKLMNI